MGKVLFTGDANSQQAIGTTLDNGVMQAFLVRQDKPREYISLQGIQINDAPTYNLSPSVANPSYEFINGQNAVVEDKLNFENVKSIDFVVPVPNTSITVMDRLFQMQKNCTYDLILLPNDCESGCDKFFWLAQSVTIGVSQITNGIIGYDANRAPITRTRSLSVRGQMRQYNGKELQILTASTGAVALYSVVVVDDKNSNCVGCVCPYQTIYRGGAALVEFSTDGGNTWTAIDVTAVTADVAAFVATSLDYKDGRLILGYSDVANALGTDGGVAYSDGNAAFVLSTMNNASLGVQSVVRSYGKVISFGSAGEVFESCDNGVTFTQITQSATTETLIDVDVDTSTGIIHIVGTNGAYITYNNTVFADETANLNAGAVNLLSVEASGKLSTIWVGDSVGNLFINDSWSAGDTDWVTIVNVTNAIGAIAVDNNGYETIFGESAELHSVSGFSYGENESVTTLVVGNVMAAYAPLSSTDESSSQVFHFVTDAGNHYVYSECNLCVENNC